MFRRAHRQETACHESSLAAHPCRKHTNGLRRIVSVLMLAVPAALLVMLSIPASPAAAKTLAAPDPTTCGTTVAELEQCTFQLINSYRADQGLPPYLWDDNLANAARAHSELWLTFAEGDCPPYGHQCPGEPDPTTRITTAVGSCKSCAENVGYGSGYPTPDYYALILNVHQNTFIPEGPCGCYNHYDNIMSTTFQHVGIGVAIDANHVRFTEDFVQP